MFAARQSRGDFKRYLNGVGIDIGCGGDPLQVPHGTVLPWDIAQGDAQELGPSRFPNEHFDFIYSSHCLEHLRDVDRALLRWVNVLKRGGALYIVVPDFELYEHRVWPSMFNFDHKHAFSMWVPEGAVVKNMMTLAGKFSDLLRTVRLELEDYGFDYALPPSVDQTSLGNAVAQICWVALKL